MKKIIYVLCLMFLGGSSFGQSLDFPDDSLFQLSSEWKNQNEETFKLASLKDQQVIIGMVYTGCAHACPMTISKVQEIEQAFIKKGVKNYKIVLASFDTKNDNPSVLKKHMKSRGLDENRWIFLSTPEEKTARELAVSLGISYKAIGDGDFSHSNVISYLNTSGVVKGKIEGLNSDISSIVDVAQEDKQK